jgi:ABC-type glycerol-3-phosphate transport system permease component
MMKAGRTLIVIASGLLLAALGFPLYWMLIASMTPESSLFASQPLLPVTLSLDHYRALFDQRDFWIPIRNSLIVATATALVALPIATACAYALARLPMRGRGFLLALILAVSMFPQISVVTPLYLILRELHLLNTYPGLVLPYVTFSTPLAVWLLTAFIRQLPRDLEDAAMIDGASRLRAARDVVLPLAAPGIASTAILTFLYCWNEFLFALSFTLGPERYTVPVAVMLFRSRYQVPWGEVLAATVIASVPIVVLVLTCQQRIVAGLSAGASKG